MLASCAVLPLSRCDHQVVTYELYPIPVQEVETNANVLCNAGRKFVLHVDEGVDEVSSACALVLQEGLGILNQQAKAHEALEEGRYEGSRHRVRRSLFSLCDLHFGPLDLLQGYPQGAR